MATSRTLADVNIERYSAPSLTFRGHAENGRVALWCEDSRGAVEAWHFGDVDELDGVLRGGAVSLGGVEVHSRAPMHGHADPDHDECPVLGGAPCWHDGSSLAWSERFLPLLAAGQDKALMALLAAWHHDEFNVLPQPFDTEEEATR